MADNSLPSAHYLRWAKQFSQAVGIAADVLADVPQSDRIIEFGLQLKTLAQQPPRTLTGLRSLEAAFVAYWNEASGQHVNRFWELIAEAGLPYERTDVVGDVLKRGSIRTSAEYESLLTRSFLHSRLGGPQASRQRCSAT
jgi:hypothetical protein